MPNYQAGEIKPQWKLPFDSASWPSAVVFAGGARRVVAGNQNGALLVWNLPAEPEQGKVLDDQGKETDGILAPAPALQLVGHTNAITHLVAPAAGDIVVSASLDRTLCVWNLAAAPTGEGEIVLDRQQRQNRARRVEESKRAEILSAPGLKLKTLAPAAVLKGHADWINALGLSGNGEKIISGDDSGLTLVWSLPERRELSRWQNAGVAWVSAVALDAQGETAAVAQYRRKGGDFNNYPAGLRLHQAASGELKLDILATLFPKEKNPPYQYQYEYHKFIAHGLVALAFSPDGKLLAAGQGGEEGDGQIHLIDTTTGQVVRSLGSHKYGVTDLAFTADGQHLFTCGRDTQFRIFRVAEGKEVATLGQPRGGQFHDWLSALALSPDEKWLAASDIAGHVQLWRLANG